MGFSGEILSDKGHAEEFVCAICVQLVDLEESLLTSCSHVFCRSCLQEWLKRKKTCPTCQNELDKAGTSSVPYLKHGSPLAWRVLSRVRIKCPLGARCSWMGDYSELQGHLMSSTEHADAAPQNSRETALALKEQANEKYLARNFKDAVRLYTKAISMCDDIPALFANRGAVFLTLGNHELALADCERAVALDPAFTKAWVRGAKALINLGRFAEASALLERCQSPECRADPTVGSTERKARTLQAEFAKAASAISAGDYVAARNATTTLLAHSAAPPVLTLAARAEAEAGSCERALKLTLQALRAAGQSDPAAFVVRALAMLYSGEVDDAIKYVKEALRLAPDDRGAMAAFKRAKMVRNGLSAARAAASEKDHHKAVEIISELLRAADTDELALPPRALLRATLLAERGNSHFRLAQHDLALRDCSQAVYLQEDNKRAWLTKAYVLHAQGRHEEALKDMEALMQGWGQNDAVIRGAYEQAQFQVRKAKRPDYYAILSVKDGDGVEPSPRPLTSLSSEVEIKSAYKRKAMLCHPDRLGPSASQEDRQRAEAEFKLVGEALEVLGDSFKRKLYDQGYDKEAIEERVRRASEQQHGHGHGHGR